MNILKNKNNKKEIQQNNKMKLTEIARKTIEAKLNNQKFELDEKTKQKYIEIKASFVTLTLFKQLRGCIGSLQASRPLWKDVQENAIHAGFHDPRFPPVDESEIKNLNIEISVLSTPEQLQYKDEKDLLKKLNKKIGLILKSGYRSATFLPQVWEELPDKVEFLENLSMKAGLNKDAWKHAEYWYYTVKKEKESK